MTTTDTFSNFAVSSIAAGASTSNLLTGETSLTLATGSGALFPSSFPFYLVLGPDQASPEIVQVTNRSGDVCTIVRAQDGTSQPSSWLYGTLVQHTLVAQNLRNLWTAVLNTPTTLDYDGHKITSDGSGNTTLQGDVTFSTGGAVKWTGGRVDPANDTTPKVVLSATNNKLDLVAGTAGLRVIKNSGSSYVPLWSVNADGDVVITGNAAVQGNLTITGSTSFSGVYAATQLAISGETAPYTLVTASPNGYSATPTVLLKDDGTLTLKGNSSGVETTFVNIVPNNVGAATVQFHGVADNVPATGVTSGALSGGVTIAATQVTSGALPSGVTIAGNQLTGNLSITGTGSFSGALSTSSTLSATSGLSTDTVLIASDGRGNLTLKATPAPSSTLSLATTSTSAGTSYSAAVLADSPLRYYRLGESSGTTMNDASGHVNGTYNAATQNQTGALNSDSNTAVSFNGTSTNWASAAGTSLPTGSSAWSMEAWFQLASYPASFTAIACWGTVGTGTMAWFYCNSAGQVGISTNQSGTAAGPLALNTWYHAVITYGSGTYTVYLNGLQAAQVTGTAPSVSTGSTLYIGKLMNSTDFFNGLVDEVAIYSGALSATRVAAHYAIGAGGPGADVRLGVGTYQYKVSYTTTLGETALGPNASVATTLNNQAVNITGLPLGPVGTLGRKLYRTVVGGSTYLLLTTLADNTTTSYSDTTPDASLGAAQATPTAGSSVWYDASSNLTTEISATSGLVTAGGLTLRNTVNSYTTGLLTFQNTLSAANKLADLQQGYGLWSDNAAGTFSGGTTRLWFDGPLNGEMHFGGRSSGNVLAGIRFRAKLLTMDNNSTTQPVWTSPAGTTSGHQLFVGTGTPSGAAEGDIWVVA